MVAVACRLSPRKLFQANLATIVEVLIYHPNADLKMLFAIHATKLVTLPNLAGGRNRDHQHHNNKTVTNLNKPTKYKWEMVQY